MKFFEGKRLPFIKIITLGLLPSTVKIFYYKHIRKYKIGKGVTLGSFSIIDCDGLCTIDDYVKIGNFCYISTNTLQIGKYSIIRSLNFIKVFNLKIHSEVIISENTIIKAQILSKYSYLELNDRVHIFPFSFLDPSRRIIIGEETAVGFYCSIFSHGSYKNILEGYKVTFNDVIIGKRVELTYQVFVAPGVIIDDDVIVGYGSYVNNNLPSGVLAAGSPAKIKRYKEQFAPILSLDEKIKIIEKIINEFCEHLVSIRTIDEYNRTGEVWTLVKKQNLYSIFFMDYKTQKNTFDYKNDILIAFDDSDIQMITKNNREIGYFNLENYECHNNSWRFFIQLKEYFERYGIRFKIK